MLLKLARFLLPNWLCQLFSICLGTTLRRNLRLSNDNRLQSYKKNFNHANKNAFLLAFFHKLPLLSLRTHLCYSCCRFNMQKYYKITIHAKGLLGLIGSHNRVVRRHLTLWLVNTLFYVQRARTMNLLSLYEILHFVYKSLCLFYVRKNFFSTCFN